MNPSRTRSLGAVEVVCAMPIFAAALMPTMAAAFVNSRRVMFFMCYVFWHVANDCNSGDLPGEFRAGAAQIGNQNPGGRRPARDGADSFSTQRPETAAGDPDAGIAGREKSALL